MLVLTRKTEQKIRIGKDIVITVLKVQGEQVSIGIEAPKETQIVREELLMSDLERAAAKENRKSAVMKECKTDLKKHLRVLKNELSAESE